MSNGSHEYRQGSFSRAGKCTGSGTRWCWRRQYRNPFGSATATGRKPISFYGALLNRRVKDSAAVTLPCGFTCNAVLHATSACFTCNRACVYGGDYVRRRNRRTGTGKMASYVGADAREHTFHVKRGLAVAGPLAGTARTGLWVREAWRREVHRPTAGYGPDANNHRAEPAAIPDRYSSTPWKPQDDIRIAVHSCPRVMVENSS